MPFVETRLISPTTLTTSASSALYTVPTGYSAIIKQLVVTNITGTAATFTFYIGAASAGNALFSGTSVAANDTVIINLSQVLTTGETLRALASTGSALNLTVSGVLNDGPLASTATYIADNAITSAKIADGAIVNADINASAAIAASKLANATAGQVLIGTTTTGVITPTTISGDVTVTGAGVTAIKSDVSLTGTPLAPTAAVGTNTTQLATTAFANAAGGLVLVANLPAVGNRPLSAAGVFNSTYLNYRIVLNMYGSNSGDEWYFRFLNASNAEITTGNYTRYGTSVTTSGSIVNAYDDSNNRLILGALSSNSTQISSAVIDVFHANTATRTTAHFQAFSMVTGQNLNCTMQLSVTDALTGFVVYGLAGNVFGNCRVYGYRN